MDESIKMTVYGMPADLNNDGIVNIADAGLFATVWLYDSATAGWDADYDINCDGVINNADSDMIAETFKTSGSGIRSFYYHFDGLGSVIALSDETGQPVELYQYDVYGTVKISTPTWYPLTRSQFGNRYLFTGRQFDAETGLYNYRARVYNPSIGRFLQTDPIGYGDGMNWYAYCGNNPIVLIDPWGLCGDKYNNNLTTGDIFNRNLATGAYYTAATLYHGIHTGLDAAGIYDPTPTCDFLNAAGYAGERDWTNVKFAAVSMAPYVGDAIGKGGKYGLKVAKVLENIPHSGGVYEFIAKTGDKYIGKSKDLYRRISTWLRDGKLAPQNIGSLKVTELPGSSNTDLLIRETQEILDAGDLQKLDNIRYPIKEADWPQYGIKRPE